MLGDLCECFTEEMTFELDLGDAWELSIKSTEHAGVLLSLRKDTEAQSSMAREGNSERSVLPAMQSTSRWYSSAGDRIKG